MKEVLLIKVEGKKIRLELQNEKGIVDTKEWQEDGNLSKTLLVGIDELLTKNRLKISDIDPDIKVETDNDSYTSARIASVVAKIMKYSLS
jgi:hypothetical protein